jgi:hypothetical protein
MDSFSYVMSLLSVVMGLGIAHILQAFGHVVHRLRGQGAPIRIDLVYGLWVVFVLMWFVVLWWAEYKFHSIGFEWSVGSYLLVIIYAISLFVVAVILVPSDFDDIDDTYAYFMEGRGWFFGALAIANILDFFDSLLKGTEWALRAEYLFSQTMLLLVCCAVGCWSNSRSVQVSIALLIFCSQIFYAWDVMTVLGPW